MVDKITSWVLNANQFMTHDTEEVSALELVAKTAYKTNEVVGEVNTEKTRVNAELADKTPLTGDHKGTWKGYLPTEVDETVGGRLTEHDVQLAETTPEVYVDTFEVVIPESDDTGRIQRAIDFCNNTYGGGIVKFASKKYVYSTTIHIKENVRLQGNKNTIMEYVSSSAAGLIFYKRTSLRDITTSFIHPDYNDSALLFSSDYVSGTITVDKSSGIKIDVEGLTMYSVCTGDKPNKTAIHIISKDIAGGIWDNKFQSCKIRGFDTIFKLETQGSGWINGNLFENVVVMDFVNVTKTEKSIDSHGIDYNLFKHLVVQAGIFTKDLFIDYNSKNVYSELETYDMHVFTDARIGYANVVGSVNGTYAEQKTKYTHSLKTKYHLLGDFISSGSTSWYAIFSFKNGSLDIDTEIAINSNFNIRRKHKGSLPLDSSQLQFFKKTLSSGLIEIYAISTSERDISVFLDGSAGFTMSEDLTFDSVTDLETMTADVSVYIYTSINDTASHTAKLIDSSGGIGNERWVKDGDGTMTYYNTLYVSAVANIPTTHLWSMPITFFNDTAKTAYTTNIVSVNDSWDFSVGLCSVTSPNGVDNTLHFNASRTQTYTVTVAAIGRWE